MTVLSMATTSDIATREVGAALAPSLAVGDVVLLSGDLGAGKTQLTKGLAAGLCVGDPVTSPTFNIMLVHQGRLPLYHLDLYRLDAADQLEDLDYFATLEGDGVVVVEWGDRFAEAQPRDGLSVEITIEGDDERNILVRSLGRRGDALIDAWRDAAFGLDGVIIESDGTS